MMKLVLKTKNLAIIISNSDAKSFACVFSACVHQGPMSPHNVIPVVHRTPAACSFWRYVSLPDYPFSPPKIQASFQWKNPFC